MDLWLWFVLTAENCKSLPTTNGNTTKLNISHRRREPFSGIGAPTNRIRGFRWTAFRNSHTPCRHSHCAIVNCHRAQHQGWPALSRKPAR